VFFRRLRLLCGYELPFISSEQHRQPNPGLAGHFVFLGACFRPQAGELAQSRRNTQTASRQKGSLRTAALLLHAKGEFPTIFGAHRNAERSGARVWKWPPVTRPFEQFVGPLSRPAPAFRGGILNSVSSQMPKAVAGFVEGNARSWHGGVEQYKGPVYSRLCVVKSAFHDEGAAA